MNSTPRTRFVTLMAAAAGVTAGLGSLAGTPALAHPLPVTELAADTLPSAAVKPGAKAAAGARAAEKTAAKPVAKGKAGTVDGPKDAKQAGVAAKAVVKTASPAPSENDACENEADCANGDGTGY